MAGTSPFVSNILAERLFHVNRYFILFAGRAWYTSHHPRHASTSRRHRERFWSVLSNDFDSDTAWRA